MNYTTTNDEDKRYLEAVQHLKEWQEGIATHFKIHLYDLISRADQSNKAKLSEGFPCEVAAYNEWSTASTEKEFFKRYGL